MTDQKKQLLDAINKLRNKCDRADSNPAALIQMKVSNFIDDVRRSEIELLDGLDEIVLEIDEDENPEHINDIETICDRILKMTASIESWLKILH